ncbi:D-lyxose/D-mannose family sugar isomerase [Tianweitania sp. BSSL-BM11]|uniref:D-lyxose ketol-isomerase n=1 Tax=Tianweitania aestuarii TaxID=2814886 RepID=A0ABS5RX48_9HYPH|nr:D-lyxose/D-mannose family sugar isomerase [Tianweitania aestuarii]MBS9721355.1 D-lyxose/D-mannose family sugar isomerase [Tianweitania aestuarii]
MKRSEINAAVAAAQGMLQQYNWALPDWANWGRAEHNREPELSAWLVERQMGWDVTDFGEGDFASRGLTLFCVRNGLQGRADDVPYAEKLLFVGVGQETPFHMHKIKVEDIIVRGGGRLAVEFTRERSLGSHEDVRVDGRSIPAFNGPVFLEAGQSVRIPRGLQHRFWGEDAPVFVAEVSQCNDDLNDNFFLGGTGRFADIEEDVEPAVLLWSDPRA